MRAHSPSWLLRLGWAKKPSQDCGEHEFYNEDDLIDRCYHCWIGQRPHVN
jgi:hypothetical protein